MVTVSDTFLQYEMVHDFSKMLVSDWIQQLAYGE